MKKVKTQNFILRATFSFHTNTGYSWQTIHTKLINYNSKWSKTFNGIDHTEILSRFVYYHPPVMISDLCFLNMLFFLQIFIYNHQFNFGIMILHLHHRRLYFDKPYYVCNTRTRRIQFHGNYFLQSLGQLQKFPAILTHLDVI